MAEAATKKYVATVGRRKRSIAQIRLTPGGSGAIVVNTKTVQEYFPTDELRQSAVSPLKAVDMSDKVDVSILVKGGGMTGQAESMRMGIARALCEHNPEWRTTLKKLGFLTRDPRKRERKKPGLRSARRAPQFSKR